jgi:hypothetical protein
MSSSEKGAGPDRDVRSSALPPVPGGGAGFSQRHNFTSKTGVNFSLGDFIGSTFPGWLPVQRTATMQHLSRLVIQLSIALSIIFPSGSLHAAPASASAWTVEDLNAAVDAAVAAADGLEPPDPQLLWDLADALRKGPAVARAPEVLLKAAYAVRAARQTEVSSIIRDAVAERVATFAERGDLQAAGTLIDAGAVDPADRARLLGHFGAGRAKAGDIDGALAAAEEIRGIAAPDRPSGRWEPTAVERIGATLAESGGADAAVRLAYVSGFALSSIAAAQARVGDLRGAFTTALRITVARGRFEALLPLVSVPPRQ